MASPRMRIMCIVGARPNMMKMAPLVAQLRLDREIEPVLVHTGQHYDYSMSQVFFDQLHMPQPDFNLGVGSGRDYAQTAEIMRRFGELIQSHPPDVVVVAGDVNSTVACALVAAREQILLAHVEAGLRSFDSTMPEEHNRILTDKLADLLFTTEESAHLHLANEGISPEKVFFVGNLMIDSLVEALRQPRQISLRTELGLQPGTYAVLTLHRPATVDEPRPLAAVLAAVGRLARQIPVVFPAHPRTARNIEAAGLESVKIWQGGAIDKPALWMMPPASYLDFLDLMQHAEMMITDSGGVQEEATFLGIPCLTYRNNTERPVTVAVGTNTVVGCDPDRLLRMAMQVLKQPRPARNVPPLWDGHSAPRIVPILKQACERNLERDAERVRL